MTTILGSEINSPLPSLGAAALQQQFRCSPYWSVRQLICVFDRGCVTIRGTLPSYYLKQVAQTIAMKSLGSDHIHSDIDVQPELHMFSHPGERSNCHVSTISEAQRTADNRR